MSTETTTIDRATLALLDRLGIKPEDADDLPEADVAVALVLRVVRDDMLTSGLIASGDPVQQYLARRIASLGVETVDGDTIPTRGDLP